MTLGKKKTLESERESTLWRTSVGRCHGSIARQTTHLIGNSSKLKRFTNVKLKHIF